MKTLILYNPLSGNGGAEAKVEELKKAYEAQGELTALDVTKIDDLPPILSEYNEDDTVIICGGDGTLNRFVYDTESTPLKSEVLYCAVGTGNDFLRDIGKSVDDAPFSVKKYLCDLPVVEIDGKKSRFLNGIGFGIDGYCCEEGDRLKAANPDKAVNYAGIAIKGVLGKFKPRNAVVTVDGVEYKYPMVWIAATMHGKYYGGGMMCAPLQDRLNEDGTNTVVVWYGSGKIKTLTRFSSIFKGEHVKYTDMIAVHTGHNVTVRFDAPCPLQIDGETRLGVTEYKVTAKALAKV
ncbi:MAG: diacylglycerol kinase family protein [Clostridia bacterium]|nr:diacylglycerol kinase family protein [Clostridia bacterium]